MELWLRVLQRCLQPSGEIARRTGASVDVGAGLGGAAIGGAAQLKAAVNQTAQKIDERVGREASTIDKPMSEQERRFRIEQHLPPYN